MRASCELLKRRTFVLQFGDTIFIWFVAVESMLSQQLFLPNHSPNRERNMKRFSSRCLVFCPCLVFCRMFRNMRRLVTSFYLRRNLEAVKLLSLNVKTRAWPNKNCTTAIGMTRPNNKGLTIYAIVSSVSRVKISLPVYVTTKTYTFGKRS